MSLRVKLLGSLLAALVAAQIAASVLLRRGDTLTITNDLIQGALLLVAAICFLPNALRSERSSHRARIFWTLMTAGIGLWLAYQIIWNYFEVVLRKEVPEVFSGDVVLFLHLVPMMAALAVFPHFHASDRDTRIRILDLTLLLTWWVFLYVYIVIPWQTVEVNAEIYGDNFNSVYLAEKLVLLVSLAALAYGAHGGWRNLYAQLLGASALYASSSYVANWAISHGQYYSGSIYDIPLAVSMAWTAAVGLFAPRWELHESKPTQPIFGVWITRLGMAAMFSLPWFAIYSLMLGTSPAVRKFRITLALFTMVLLGVMVFLRQNLLARELSMLLEKSRRAYDELKNLQAQLIESEKLASLGQLVGGAAHEINNPLTAMMGYSDILNSSSLPSHEQRMAARIAEQVRRTKTLVASLLTFAHESPVRTTMLDPNSVLRTALRLIQPQLDAESIHLELALSSTLPPIMADSNQLLHVCLHLAAQVTSEMSGEKDPKLHVTSRRESKSIVIDFSGNTAPADAAFHALETPHNSQRSLSLSLNACRRIAEEHGGRVLVQDTPGGHTAFRLELPIAVEGARPSDPFGSVKLPRLADGASSSGD